MAWYIWLKFCMEYKRDLAVDIYQNEKNLEQNLVTVTVRKFMSTLAKFASTLASKSIQMTYSLKPLHPWFLNFTYSMTRLQGFRMIKFRLVGNQKWPLLLKIAKPLKSTFCQEPLDIFGWNFVKTISCILIFRLSKWKKSIAELDHNDLPGTSCLCAQFCLNANISWNAEQNLVTFNQNDLQMEFFQIYVTFFFHKLTIQNGCLCCY